MKYFVCLLIPASLFAQRQPVLASPGSLFAPSGMLADAARDVRASRMDDIVTIVVADNLSAVASGATNTSRKSSAQHQINAAMGVLSAASKFANPLSLAGDQELAGTGATSRNMTLSTTVSARVVDITANGTLVVEGTKNIGVNSEKQSITVRGFIRPEDVSQINTILSTQVADLQVKVNGKGVVGDAIRRPNFLYRLLLGLLPF
jgi:flagellar L-ring protein precursor FlgH